MVVPGIVQHDEHTTMVCLAPDEPLQEGLRNVVALEMPAIMRTN